MKFFEIFRLSSAGNVAVAPTAPARTPRLAFFLIYGGVSFAAVSVLAFSIWAFHWVPGTAALYATTAAVYIALAGLALSHLVIVTDGWKRFSLLFALVFVAYAACWCACWFGLKGRYRADLLGAATGLAAMTWLLLRAFGKTRGFLRAYIGLFVLHSVGYYIGGEFHALVRDVTGRLLWGASYGLGFGAGLGYVLFHCQTPSRPSLPTA